METNLQANIDVLPDLRDADIVPEDVQNELMMLRSGMTAAAFRIGDIANALFAQSVETGLRVTAMRVYIAVGNFVGKSPRTVRYYAETAAAFGIEARQTYETLPFSTFVYARSQASKTVEILEYALAHPLVSEMGLRIEFQSPYETFVPTELGTDDEFRSKSVAEALGIWPRPQDNLGVPRETVRREISGLSRDDLFVELSVALDKLDGMLNGLSFDMKEPEVKTAVEEIQHGLALIRSGIPALNRILKKSP